MIIPDKLYHYTSQNGLIGILSTKSIWATNIRYLNDAKEFEYASDFLNNTITDLSMQLAISRKIISSFDVIQHLINETNTLNFQVNVSSFSENGDALSQWRAYCPNAAGFSLGFDFSKLKSLAKERSFKLAKCIYEPEIQYLVIERMINYFNDVLRRAYESGRNLNECLNLLSYAYVNRLFPIASLFKHPSFYEEKEWRLISPIQDYDNSVMLREGKNFMIPYVEIKLEDKNVHPIKEIYIGPNLNKKLCFNSVFYLLKKNGIKNCDIKFSNIPYREC